MAFLIKAVLVSLQEDQLSIIIIIYYNNYKVDFMISRQIFVNVDVSVNQTSFSKQTDNGLQSGSAKYQMLFREKKNSV